jgi:hypothetical protein
LPPAVFLGLAVRTGRLRRSAPSRDLFVAVLLGSLAFLVISIPVMTSPQAPTAVSLGNNDIAVYALLAKHFKELPLSQPIAFMNPAITDHVLAYRSAAFLSTALPGSLFSVEVYKLQNVAVAVFFSLGTPLVHAVATRVFGYKPLPAFGVAALYSLSPVLYYVAYEGFGAQIIAMTLSLGVLFLHSNAADSCKSPYDYLPYMPLAFLLNWAIVTTYLEMLALAYLFAGCYVVSASISARSPKALLNWGLFSVSAVVSVFLLSPWRLKPLVEFLVVNVAGRAGYHLPAIPPHMVFGLTFSHVTFDPYASVLHYWPSLLVILAIVGGLVSAYVKDRRLLLFAAFSLVSVAAGYFWFAYQSKTGWGGYRSFKLISFVLPGVLLSSLLLFRDLQPARSAIDKLLALLFLALIGGNLVSAYHTLQMTRSTGRAVTRDQADLARLEKDPSIESVNVLGSDWWRTMWSAHFLMRKKLYFESDTYYQRNKLEGAWDLIFDGKPGIVRLPGFTDFQTIRLNQSYALEKGRPLKARLGKGWYPEEESHQWSGRDYENATIVLESSLERINVDLLARYVPLDINNRMTIYLNGARIVDCPDSSSCQARSVSLPKGNSILEFRTAIPPKPPGGPDPRTLGYAFSMIEIRPSAAEEPRLGPVGSGTETTTK